jgi:hypothetical protein
MSTIMKKERFAFNATSLAVLVMEKAIPIA